MLETDFSDNNKKAVQSSIRYGDHMEVEIAHIGMAMDRLTDQAVRTCAALMDDGKLSSGQRVKVKWEIETL